MPQARYFLQFLLIEILRHLIRQAAPATFPHWGRLFATSVSAVRRCLSSNFAAGKGDNKGENRYGFPLWRVFGYFHRVMKVTPPEGETNNFLKQNPLKISCVPSPILDFLIFYIYVGRIAVKYFGVNVCKYAGKLV